MPTKRIQAIPKDIPATFILLNIMPKAMTNDSIKTDNTTSPLPKKRLASHKKNIAKKFHNYTPPIKVLYVKYK